MNLMQHDIMICDVLLCTAWWSTACIVVQKCLEIVKSSANKTLSPAKKATPCQCPICEEQIVDATQLKPGQESIFCDGPCKSWLHRRCAGLTKKAFQSISLPDKFYCPMCRLSNNESELEKLRVRVADLEAKLSALLPAEESANSSAWADAIKSSGTTSGTNKACPSGSAPNTGDTSDPTVNHKSKDSSSQRRFNLVVFGLEESGKGTPKFQHNRHDIEIAGELLSWLDPIVDTFLIVAAFRLGRYSDEKARPLLVKLTRPNDVQIILMVRKKLASRPEIAIKPDMS